MRFELTAKNIAGKLNHPVDRVRYVLRKLQENRVIGMLKMGNTCLYKPSVVKKVRGYIKEGRFK